jgi:hypothetical protein
LPISFHDQSKQSRRLRYALSDSLCDRQWPNWDMIGELTASLPDAPFMAGWVFGKHSSRTTVIAWASVKEEKSEGFCLIDIKEAVPAAAPHAATVVWRESDATTSKQKAKTFPTTTAAFGAEQDCPPRSILLISPDELPSVLINQLIPN